MAINAVDVTVRAAGGVLLPIYANKVLTAGTGTFSLTGAAASTSLSLPIDETVVAESASYSLQGAIANTSSGGAGVSPEITQPPHAEISAGNTFSYTPSLSEGDDVFWFKEYGPDTMTVDQETGQITWDTSVLPRGQGILVGLACSPSTNDLNESETRWFVIHVDATGTSRLRELGTDTLSPYIRPGSDEMSAGDSLVVPAGERFGNVTGNESRENTWGDADTELKAGSNTQMTTIIGAGEVVIDFSAHGGIPEHPDVGLDFASGGAVNRDYVKFCSLEFIGPRRQAVVYGGDYCLMELVGAADSGASEFNTTYSQAGGAFQNLAAGYLQGNYTSWESSYAYGQCRYGLQHGLSVTGCLTQRNIVRLDHYTGDQPRGGIVHYGCNDVGAYNNFVIDANQEHLAPFYKNFAGAFACPATGVEGFPETLDFNGNLTINSELAWGLIDSTESTTVFQNKNAVGIDISDSVAPQTGNSGAMGIMSDHRMLVDGAAFYRTYSYLGTGTLGVIRATGSPVNVQNSIIYQPGWNGSTTVDYGDVLEGTASSLTNSLVYDPGGGVNTSGGSTSGLLTIDALINGWDYPVRVEAGSPLALAGIGPDLTNFKSPSNVLPGDPGWQTETDVWAWPHPAEQRIRARMQAFNDSGLAIRREQLEPNDFTGTLTGARGFCAAGESFSEYIWGYFGRTVPPLRASAKLTGQNEITFRVGKYRSSRGDSITGFNVYESSNMVVPVLSFTGLKGVLSNVSAGESTYYIRAVDPTSIPAYGANFIGESGNSRALVVNNDTPSFLVENLTLNSGINSSDWSDLGTNAGSGFCWVSDYGTVLIGINGTDALYEYALSDLSTRIRTISLSTGLSDSEDVCWMGNDEIAVCYEDAGQYIIAVFDYIPGTSNTTWFDKQQLEVAPQSAPNNSGAEGICYDPVNTVWYVVGEGQQGGADREFFKVERPTNTTTDYDYNDAELTVTEPWDAESVLNSYGSSGASFDLSSVAFHAATGTVVVMSHTGSMLVQLNPDTGAILSDYALPGGQQWEGLDFINNDGDMIATAESANYQRLDAN